MKHHLSFKETKASFVIQSLVCPLFLNWQATLLLLVGHNHTQTAKVKHEISRALRFYI